MKKSFVVLPVFCLVFNCLNAYAKPKNVGFAMMAGRILYEQIPYSRQKICYICQLSAYSEELMPLLQEIQTTDVSNNLMLIYGLDMLDQAIKETNQEDFNSKQSLLSGFCKGVNIAIKDLETE